MQAAPITVLPSWFQWVQLVAPILAIVGAAIAIVRRIERDHARLDSRLERIELRIATVEFQNRALLRAFPQVISTLMAGRLMTSERGTELIATALENPAIAEILRQIKPSTNPLSQADLDRLNSYIAGLKMGGSLNAAQAQDFYRLTDIITREYPSNEGSWLLFLIGGILIGAIISDAKK